MFYLIGATICSTATSTFSKLYKKNAVLFYSALACTGACLFFLIASGFKVNIQKEFVPYSLLFALAYSLCNIFIVLAYRDGSLMITGLFLSFSQLIPAFYGLIAYNEPSKLIFWIGIAVLCLAITLVNLNGKKNSEAPEQTEPKAKKKINVKYYIFVLITCISNGGCAVFQTAEQKRFDGAYKNEFMLLALFISAVVLFIASFIMERKKIKEGAPTAALFGGTAGFINGACNLLVMLSIGVLPASIVFPVISGGGMVLTYIIASLLFKEKYTPKQYIGLLFGLVAVILLSL